MRFRSMAVLLLAACSGTPQDSGGPPGDDDDTTGGTETGLPPGDDDDDTVGDDDDDTVTGDGPAIVGIVVDAAGQPMANYDVLCCTSVTCFTTESASDGSFRFETKPPAEIAIKTHEELYESPRKAAALEPVRLLDDSVIDIDELYVPDLASGTPFGDPEDDPQTLSAGNGLELTLNRADLIPDFGVFLYDLAAAEVPAAFMPAYEDLGTEEVVAVYAIHPFATRSNSPIGVRAPTTLPAGTVVNFRSIGYLTGLFSAPATGRSDGTHVATDPGVGIDRLTYIVITTP